MKRWLPLAALTLAACSSAKVEPQTADPVPLETPPPPQPAPTGAPMSTDPRLNAHIDKVLAKATELRHLHKKNAVPGVVLGREALIAELKSHVLREVPKEAIVREGLSMKLCGLIGKELDYEAVTFRLLEEQLAGFYLPEQGHMYLAADLDETIADPTLLHELIHALQDQHFDLKSHSKYKPGQGDRTFARSALAEGDATSAMTDFMTGAVAEKSAPPDVKLEKLILLSLEGTMPDYAPKVMQKSLVAPYVYGLKFVNALRRQGGWDAVDAAWRTPPISSEQMLHVEKYQAHEAPLSIEAPAADAFGGDFRRDDEDTMGELGVRLLVDALTGDFQTANALAAGWGGDRNAFYLHKNRDRAAVAMHLRYDADAKANAAKLVRTLAGAFGASASASAGVTSFCKERPDLGPVAFATRQNSGDVSMVFGPAEVTTWRSAGTCEQALRVARAELDR